MNIRRRWTARAFAFAMLASVAPFALAQGYPNKPVRVIVPLTPGSGADIVARALGRKLQDAWGQPVIVENRPGAGGQIGTREVVKSPADGYTLLVQSASHAANPAIYASLPFDPKRDLIDVALLATTPYVMIAAKDGPYKSVQDVVDAAKARPNEQPFASAGVGSSTHLTAELFAKRAGVRMVHVPFKGSPDAIADVAGGRSAFYMAPLPTVSGMLQGGRLAPIAVTSSTRVASLPSVPTIAESGYPDFKSDLWVGLWAPAGTPSAVIEKLSADIRKALDAPDVQEQYAKSGNAVRWMTPAAFSKFVHDEIDANKVLVKDAGIKPE